MDIIGKNYGSKLRIYIYGNGEMQHVPYKYNDWDNDELIQYMNDHGHKVERVVDNFYFTSVIVPLESFATRQSGSILFADKEHGTEFRMTQRNILGFLNSLLAGTVKIKDDGFYGMYTFDGAGGILTIKVAEV